MNATVTGVGLSEGFSASELVVKGFAYGRFSNGLLWSGGLLYFA